MQPLSPQPSHGKKAVDTRTRIKMESRLKQAGPKGSTRADRNNQTPSGRKGEGLCAGGSGT
jgi:hypothetical protein